MKKILVIGNSGSGKTWLGKKLATILSIPHVELDKIFWEPGSHNKKRMDEVVEADIKRIQGSRSWVVEGVFGHLVDHFVFIADTLVHLDLPWEECERNLLIRGSESSKQLDHKKAEENFQVLLEWASEYDTRDSKASEKYHCALFDCFSGKKHRVYNRDEINQLLKHCKP